MAKILVVDDNLETLKAVKDILESERHVVDCTSSASEAWDFIQTYDYELLIFDWEMPEMSGMQLLQKYKTTGAETPVLMLTGRSSTPDKITGLDGGADNYLTKPFEKDELLSYVRAMLRRAPLDNCQDIIWCDLRLQPSASTISCGEKSCQLSKKELDVLKLLLTNSARLISHEELKLAAWADSPETTSGSIRVFLSSLREKLASLGSKIQIVNVKGYGYQIRSS